MRGGEGGRGAGGEVGRERKGELLYMYIQRKGGRERKSD